MSDMIDIEFEGDRIAARAGESLAAALVAHGVSAFRTTREGAERNVFCGMGVCQDCLVEVDGKPNQRACMTKVDRPLVVRREAHARPLADTPAGQPPVTLGDIALERPEILIIGAGPGGLSAAIAARRAGASPVVLDERAHAGGQYFKQVAVDGAGMEAPDAQHREGAELIRTALGLGVEIRTGVAVWGAFQPNEYAATVAGRTMRFQPQAAIIATGAYERGWPVAGWTLPGVMTTGAAQTLWRTARRLPGARVLIAGNGPLNLQLAAELSAGGAKVAAVVEAAPRPGMAEFGAALAMLSASPGLVRDGLRYQLALRRAKVPSIYGKVVTGVEKSGAGLRVRLSAGGERFDVDTLCMGYGFEPSNELLRMLGCRHDYDAGRRQLVTRCDSTGLTSVPHVYALGDCTGLGGARVAMAQGILTGFAAAAALGHPLTTEAIQLRSRAIGDLARHRRFQRALWQIYLAPGWNGTLASPDTLICRCEEVSLGQIEAALAEDLQQIGAIKRLTRAGMGRCQGRYCAPVIDALLAERCGNVRDEFSGFAPRPPVRPVTISDLVG